jgi:hypothetical protein
MNDDYLWDKSGQPDPQIQQLEEILGTLRYQPKSLAIPRRRNYWPLLAIAASVLLAIAAGSIWLGVRSRTDAPKQQAKVEEPAPPKPPVNKSAVNQPPRVAINKRRKRSASSAAERQEARRAKEQLMLALRVTTRKLHLVHTKTE